MNQLPSLHPESDDKSEHAQAALPAHAGHQSNALVVLVVGAALFFILAIAAAVWLLVWGFGDKDIAPVQVGDGSENVSKVEFVAPDNLAAGYSVRPQNTHNTKATYYTHQDNSCSIATQVHSVQDLPVKAKEVAENSLKQLNAFGVNNNEVQEGSEYTFADVDNQHTYAFATLRAHQSVDLPGVDFNSQQQVVAYKQFGASKVASISYSCPSTMWEQHNQAVEATVQQFKLKTER